MSDETEVRVFLDAIEIGVGAESISIHWSVPGQCTFSLPADPDSSITPQIAQDVRIVLNDLSPRVLFHGSLQTIELSHQDGADNWIYKCTAADTTVRLNKYRPFGSWINISATIVVQELMATNAPSFSVMHVASGLPPVTIEATGDQELSALLQEIATQFGGYQHLEDLELHMSLTGE